MIGSPTTAISRFALRKLRPTTVVSAMQPPGMESGTWGKPEGREPRGAASARTGSLPHRLRTLTPRELDVIDALDLRSAAQPRRRSWIDSRSFGGVGRLLPGSSARVLVEAIQSR